MNKFGPSGICPLLVSNSYNEISYKPVPGEKLNHFLDTYPERYDDALNAVCETIFAIHLGGFNHCDLSPDNIICDIDAAGTITARVIDSEYARQTPPNLPCEESFDFRGNAAWIKDHFGHPYSGHQLTPGALQTMLQRMASVLKERLYEVTGSQADIPDRRYMYHSFDLPGLKISLPEAQRDVPARFDRMGLEFTNKTVVDVGANVGGMALEAAKRGATTIGLEKDSKRVKVANDLAAFAGFDAKFREFDVVHHAVPEADIIFFCAVDGYIEDKAAAYQKVADAARETLIFESNRKDQLLSTDDWLALWKGLGFKNVTSLGTSTDDVRVENHWRQVFRCDRFE